jgi:hypothetical protein
LCRPEAAGVAPDQKPANYPAISAARVFIANAGLEKFISGESRIRGLLQDGDRDRRYGKRRAAHENQFSG